MSLETGGPHPLAREPDLQLGTELSVNLLDVRVDAIGDQIVLVLVDLRIRNPESDSIYLVDWKQGRMTLVSRMPQNSPILVSPFPTHLKVHRAPNGTYEGALAVLSDDLVLFLKRDVQCLELCRVTTNPRRAENGNSNGDDAPSASLCVVRTLALPGFHPSYRVHTAYMQTDCYTPRHRDPEAHQPREQRPGRAPPPLTFHSAPEDMVVGITFLLRLRGPHANWKKVVTTISHRALFALADAGTSSGTGRRTLYDEEDDGGGGEGDLEREQEVGEGEVVDEVDIVPWAEWGPRATRIISPPTFHWITAHAGQRWLSLEDDKLVIRDFSTARVLRARASGAAPTSGSPAYLRHNDAGAGNGSNGTGPVLAPAQTRIRGHGQSQAQAGSTATCFGEDVVSELPFVETRVDVHGRAEDMVLTDGERLISFVRMVSSPAPPFSNSFSPRSVIGKGGHKESYVRFVRSVLCLIFEFGRASLRRSRFMFSSLRMMVSTRTRTSRWRSLKLKGPGPEGVVARVPRVPPPQRRAIQISRAKQNGNDWETKFLPSISIRITWESGRRSIPYCN